MLYETYATLSAQMLDCYVTNITLPDTIGGILTYLRINTTNKIVWYAETDLLKQIIEHETNCNVSDYRNAA